LKPNNAGSISRFFVGMFVSNSLRTAGVGADSELECALSESEVFRPVLYDDLWGRRREQGEKGLACPGL